jgi:hypothetical protein
MERATRGPRERRRDEKKGGKEAKDRRFLIE